MRQRLLSLLLCAVLVAPVFISGCATRVYDVDHHDYHRWDSRERGYYVQWENETHRSHQDFDRRSDAEQREYWNWRHSHQDHP